MTVDLRREITELYLQVGNLLNTVEDDDQRETLQEHGENVLNDELFAGSQTRKLAAPLHAALAGLGFRPVDNVVAIPVGSHSLRVQECEPPDDYLTGRGPYLMDARSENDRSL